MPADTRLDLRREHRVETPELVALTYELAGVGSRTLAALADYAILLGLGLALFGALIGLRRLGVEGGAGIVFTLYGMVVLVGYHALFETFWQGRTPGKRLLGLRVTDTSGRGLSAAQAWLRNLLRLADALPPPFLIGLLLVAFQRQHRRLGDLVAGTIVVRDRPRTRAVGDDTVDTDTADAPTLDDAAFALLDRFADRADQLAPAARARIAATLAPRLGAAADGLDGDGLLRLHARERRARRAGFRAMAQARGTAAEPWAARRVAAWAEFETRAETVARRGLDSLEGDALIAFAADYRAITADLARARTYGAAPLVTQRLERLAAAAHAALYRERAGGWATVRDAVFRTWPGAVVRHAGVVTLAMAAFVVPGLAGWGLVREQPPLAYALVPSTLLERADAAETRTARGEKYVTVTLGERPSVALAIIANNVRVALLCFAGGIFGGVGALVLLGSNGLQLAAGAAHFANVGRLAYLGEFVVGHGVLELFAIWVAGAAGFLLGRAVVAPGPYTRGDALRRAGTDAAALVGAAAVLLVVAGLIEGLVSASGTTWTVRLAVAGGSALLLALYLANGALALRLRGASSAS